LEKRHGLFAYGGSCFCGLPNPEAGETGSWRKKVFCFCLHQETEWKEKEKDVIWLLKGKFLLSVMIILLLILNCFFCFVSVDVKLNKHLMCGLAQSSQTPSQLLHNNRDG